MSARPGRLAQLDVLRGIALFGILLVNIWGFAWGTLSLRYGTLATPAPWIDQAAIFLVAAFAEFKFYPIFAFLFGAGFALHTRSLRQQLGSWLAAQTAYRRRLRWLLLIGILHGLLIWSGDVLSSYALAGMLIVSLAPSGLDRIRNLAWMLAGGFLLFMALLYPVIPGMTADDTTRQLQEFAGRYAIYTQGSLLAVAALRVRDYGMQMLFVIVMLPHIIVLFSLGILSVRLGWLVEPQHHRHVWRRVCMVGLGLGLPFNLLSATALLQQTVNPYQKDYNSMLFELLLYAGGPLLAAGYVAALMLAGPALMATLAHWLAAAGRMALSNYLAQSLLATFLLQGWGLGWGARLRPVEMLCLALAIMATQVWLSRWWLARFKQGPVEALWRHLAR
ncbi:DUF418 domain-containing protein [Janthinobacterium sp. RB2R34]|uniref:DUF418 domain-containing protein n=1 Tax=Janthinobacterium sp. RB2R34 TaxID=3424193 RepID=UPI003F2461EF